MKKPDSSNHNEGPSMRPVKPTVFEKTPLLMEHLCDTRWDDGTPRSTSTLTIFFDCGLVKLCLNDREANASLYVTGETLQECLASVEKRLGGSSAQDWRQWGKRKGK